MEKRLLIVVMLVLAFVDAKASVVINSTNFPDETFRQRIAEAEWDQNGDGTLSDEELAEVVAWELHDVENFKGLEHFTSLSTLWIGRWDMERGEHINATNLDLTPLQQLWRIGIQGYGITSVDVSVCKNVTDVEIADCPNLTSFKAPAGVEVFTLTDLPSLTTFDFSIFKKLKACFFRDLGLADIDFSNHPAIERINFSGSEEKLYTLNSINVADCPELYELSFWYVKTESFRLKNLPKFYAFVAENCDCSLITVEEMPVLGSVNCTNSDIRELNIRKCPELTGVGCADNKLRTLIIDDSPMLGSLYCENNQLMWLDMSNVKNLENGEQNYFTADNQQPSTVAYKLSPSEVGLLVHERFDVEHVLNLKAGGKSVTPTWSTIDGKTYFVFSNDGANAEDLVGQNTTYEYETKWPYAWVEGNTKDNNLPVSLNVTKVEKLPSWIKLSSTETLKGKVDGTLTPPEVSRSDKYDGKLTWTSSNENVVKVDAETGALTIIGPGTAIISVSGAETDYRTAPAMVTYTVSIETGETCDITIGKNGKTTFCGDKSLDFSYSDEVKAFIATGFDKTEGTIWMTRVKDVPAGVPVMIKGTAEETYHVPVTEGGSSYYKNMFVGNTTGESMSIGETSEDSKYVNYYMSGGQFKSVKTSANIGANKCYLQLPATFEAEATGEGCQVKIAASGKSSFAAPYDLDFTSLNDDVKAFTATGYDAGTKTIWLTRVKKVQKGEGLLLKGTGGETYTIPSSGVQAAYENMIVGNIGDEITINGTSEDGTLTNYYLKGGTYMSVSGTANIGTNKSYLQLPTSMLAGTTGARSEDTSDVLGDLGTQENLGYLGNLGMPSTCHLAELETESMPIVFGSIGGDDETTGIKDNNRETITNNRDGQWFTLGGQRIDKPTKKGLYIHDGRKVVVR